MRHSVALVVTNIGHSPEPRGVFKIYFLGGAGKPVFPGMGMFNLKLILITIAIISGGGGGSHHDHLPVLFLT